MGDAAIAQTTTPAPTTLPAVTWRSLSVGTIAVILVCALTPVNDFVFSDTSLTAGFLPISAVLIEFILIVAINAPLHRFAPRAALRSGELAVIFLMTLVACSLPNWGLMRFFIPIPVAPFHLGVQDEQFWRAFIAMDLPAWLFPVDSIEDGRASTIVQWFWTAAPRGEAIPFLPWIKPLALWGVFIAAMLATLISIARMVIEQWKRNERLPFPLVQVQAALIEAPPAGRGLNALFRSPWLWVGLCAVFVFHSLTALNGYQARYFPRIPLGYDFTSVLTEEPFYSLRPQVKKATLSFIILGLTYFIRSRAAFSLWGGYLLVNVISVNMRLADREIPYAAWGDQHLGACFAFVLGIFWIGRHHWWRIIRNAIGIGGDGAYRLTFWIAVVGVGVMFGWLLVVGVKIWVAVLIIVFILVAHLVVARIAAESGLPFYRADIGASQIYSQLPISAMNAKDVYFAGVFNALGPLTARDSAMTFATTGLGICDEAEVAGRDRRRLGLVITWALVLGFVVSAATTLYCQYSFATPLMADTRPPRNYFGAERIPTRELKEPVVNFTQGKFEQKTHNVPLNIGIGFGATVLLEIASLRWASWPLLPIGYVASHGAFIANSWFSIFVGWIAKVLIVRFGGAKLFDQMRPLFVGVIFGEALAAGVWLAVNAIVVIGGGESQAIRFLP